MKTVIEIKQLVRPDEVEEEDEGTAEVIEFANSEDSDIWVQLISFDVTRQHKEMSELVGKNVRITIAVEEEH